MLLREKLEDQAVKTVELDRTVQLKKLELMRALQSKLAAAGRIDENLDRQVLSLAEKFATEPKTAKRPTSLNVVRT